MNAKFLCLVMLAAIGCAEFHEPELSGAAGSPAIRIAPGSPADWKSGYDVDVTVSPLLHSTFTCINSENGAQIWRYPSGWDPIRCFVMSKGSTGPGCNNAYWAISTLPGGGAQAVNGSKTWKATNCNSVGCSLQECTSGSCVSRGFLNYTTSSTTIFSSNPGTDGYQLITCTSNGGGSPGNPILKRYTP